MIISVETNGGMILGLIFKPSVIEMVAVDINKVIQVVELMKRKMIESVGN